METIITAATVLSMFMNLSNDVNAPYYYNADVENNQVKTLHVYNDNDGLLSARLSYRYTYDDEGRLVSKVATTAWTARRSPASAWITPTTRRATAWSAASGTPRSDALTRPAPRPSTWARWRTWWP